MNLVLPTGIEPTCRLKGELGFSLVETIIAVFIMSVVISGGLISVGQVQRMSEKSREQAVADLYLRAECEQLRAMDWTEIETLTERIYNYEESNRGSRYPHMLSLTDEQLSELNMNAEVKAEELANSDETGKNIFSVTLTWTQRSGRTNEETRVLVITEGGMSAQ